jgi:hypothetical protein
MPETTPPSPAHHPGATSAPGNPIVKQQPAASQDVARSSVAGSEAGPMMRIRVFSPALSENSTCYDMRGNKRVKVLIKTYVNSSFKDPAHAPHRADCVLQWLVDAEGNSLSRESVMDESGKLIPNWARYARELSESDSCDSLGIAKQPPPLPGASQRSESSTGSAGREDCIFIMQHPPVPMEAMSPGRRAAEAAQQGAAAPPNPELEAPAGDDGGETAGEMDPADRRSSRASGGTSGANESRLTALDLTAIGNTSTQQYRDDLARVGHSLVYGRACDPGAAVFVSCETALPLSTDELP